MITVSKALKFARCPAAYEIEYSRKLQRRPKAEPGAVSIGIAFHKAIEEWLKSAGSIYPSDPLLSGMLLRAGNLLGDLGQQRFVEQSFSAEGVVVTPDIITDQAVVDFKTHANKHDDSYILFQTQGPVYTYVVEKCLGVRLPFVTISLRQGDAAIPEVTKAGKVSKRKITTTRDIALKAVLDNGDDPDDYAEWLAELPESLDEVLWTTFSEEQCRDAMASMHQFEHLISIGLYPRAKSIFNCKMCSHADLCDAESRGADGSDIIEELYQPNEYVERLANANILRPLHE